MKSASNNVVIEDLHSTRNLETTYYVTDVTQASDFYWDPDKELERGTSGTGTSDFRDPGLILPL